MKYKFRKISKIAKAGLSFTLSIALATMGLMSMPSNSSAAAISAASTALSDSRIGAEDVTYTITVSGITTGTTISCIQVIFSTDSDGTGGLPSGMDLSSVTFAGNIVPTPGSWVAVDAGSGVVNITLAGGEAPGGSSNDRTIILGDITNGDTVATSYYTTVNTFENADCSTGPVDTDGVSAFIFTEGVLITATVDSALSFTIGDNTCELGNLPMVGTHRACEIDFSVATNASKGWNVTARGESDGASASLYNSVASYTLDANTAQAVLGAIGTNEAFGFNLVGGNTTSPATGNAVSGDTTGVTVAGDYNTANSFKWPGTTNEMILQDTDSSPGTDATILVGVNRTATTLPGNYATTLVLTVTASY